MHACMQVLGPGFNMNPYAAEYGAGLIHEEKLKPSESSDEASTATASSEYLAAMDAKYKALEEKLMAKDNVIAGLQKQLEDLKLRAETPKPDDVAKAPVAPAAAEAAVEAAGSEELAPAPAPALVSSAASRQRLRRLCERKADGSLLVPESIHQAWKSGGQARENLLQVYVGSSFNKDTFLREISVESRKSKELKVEVTGDFFTEEEMRDELKLSPYLCLADTLIHAFKPGMCMSYTCQA